MLTSKICRAHASKCTQVAGTFPPGKQRDMFSDMAKQWIRLAAKIESSEAMLNTPTANDVNGPHRFGSRIEKRKDTTTEVGDAPF